MSGTGDTIAKSVWHALRGLASTSEEKTMRPGRGAGGDPWRNNNPKVGPAEM
jgi:hypothetical protein